MDQQVNCGGLYHVEDVFECLGQGIEKVMKEYSSWICDNEEIIWCTVSPTTIESKDARPTLLQEICHLWITTRGHSKARRIKEDYKKAKGKSTKGKYSLRKELASVSVFTD